MTKVSIMFGLWASLVLLAASQDSMVAKGLWSTLSVDKCENPDQYPIDVDMIRKRLNRTHDGFDAKMKIDRNVDNSFGIFLDICQFVDGGCKKYQEISDECFWKFCKKYAEQNTRDIVELMGVNADDNEVPAGDYTVEKYVFDYTELPENGILGTFQADVYLLDGDDRVSCICFILEFKEEEEEE